ncbi:hypothetical protein D3C72_1770290 [compost metagenome]
MAMGTPPRGLGACVPRAASKARACASAPSRSTVMKAFRSWRASMRSRHAWVSARLVIRPSRIRAAASTTVRSVSVDGKSCSVVLGMALFLGCDDPYLYRAAARAVEGWLDGHRYG